MGARSLIGEDKHAGEGRLHDGWCPGQISATNTRWQSCFSPSCALTRGRSSWNQRAQKPEGRPRTGPSRLSKLGLHGPCDANVKRRNAVCARGPSRKPSSLPAAQPDTPIPPRFRSLSFPAFSCVLYRQSADWRSIDNFLGIEILSGTETLVPPPYWLCCRNQARSNRFELSPFRSRQHRWEVALCPC